MLNGSQRFVMAIGTTVLALPAAVAASGGDGIGDGDGDGNGAQGEAEAGAGERTEKSGGGWDKSGVGIGRESGYLRVPGGSAGESDLLTSPLSRSMSPPAKGIGRFSRSSTYIQRAKGGHGGRLLRVRNRKHIENIDFKKIGIGEHGQVYRGRYGNRYVSAKVCSGRARRNPDWRALEIELGMLSTAAFDHIVRMDGLFWDPSRQWLYCVYEYCPHTLCDLIEGRLSTPRQPSRGHRGGGLGAGGRSRGGGGGVGGSVQGVRGQGREDSGQLYTCDRFFDLANQLLSALEFLHEQRDISHQNLKPQNILLDKSFDLKVR